MAVSDFILQINKYAKNERRKNSAQEWLILVGLLVLVALLIPQFGMRQIGGFDHSALVDVCYRTWLGQVPYRDFDAPTPPWFDFGGAWFLSVFGLKFQSFVWGFAGYVVLICLWISSLLRSLKIPSGWRLLLTFTCASASGIVVSYWWYNPITALAATLVLINTLCFLRKDRSGTLYLSLGASYVLLLGMKPNVAALSVLASGVAFIYSGNFKRWLLLAAGALSVFFAMLLFLQVDPMGLISAYLKISGRGAPSLDRFAQDISTQMIFANKSLLFCFLEVLIGFFVIEKVPDLLHRPNKIRRFAFTALSAFVFLGLDLYWPFFALLAAQVLMIDEGDSWLRKPLFYWGFSIVFLLFWFVNKGSARDLASIGFFAGYLLLFGLIIKELRPKIEGMLVIGFSLISIYGFYSNGEFKIVDSTMMAVAVGAIGSQSRSKHLRLAILWLLFSVNVWALVLGLNRERVRAIGWPFERTRLEFVSEESSFLTGVLGPERLRFLLSEVRQVLRELPREDVQDVWFGNRLQFLYAEYGLIPPGGTPSWYHPGVTFPAGSAETVENNFKERRHKILIFPKGDRTYYPASFLAWIAGNYDLQQYQTVDVYKLKRK